MCLALQNWRLPEQWSCFRCADYSIKCLQEEFPTLHRTWTTESVIYGFNWETWKEGMNSHLGEVGKTILKWIFRQFVVCGIGSIQSAVNNFCEYGTETSGSIRSEGSLDQLKKLWYSWSYWPPHIVTCRPVSRQWLCKHITAATNTQ
jgi:hypothetical protein